MSGEANSPVTECTRDGYFSRTGLEGLLADHMELRADRSYAIFALMVLSLWMADRG